MNESLYFIIATLATFRLSLFIVDDPGPLDLLDWLRERLGIEWVYDYNSQGDPILGSGEWVAENALGETLSCFWCVSLWVGLVVAWCSRLAVTVPWFWSGLAYSGLAILLRKRFKVQR